MSVLAAIIFCLRPFLWVNGNTLETDIVNPPDSTKPWCYWYWLNGDVTKEGITKDLEAMAEVGIKKGFGRFDAVGFPVTDVHKTRDMPAMIESSTFSNFYRTPVIIHQNSIRRTISYDTYY